MNFLAQIIGLFAVFCWVISIQQKNKKNILICQIIANLFYAIQYYFLNVVLAASISLVSSLRCLVFYDDESKKVSTTNYSLFFFLIVIIILGFLSYNGLFSLIPIIIALLYTYSSWQKNLKFNRYIFIIAAFIWIYYNIKVGAYIAVIGNIVEIISGVVALIRYREIKKN